MSIIVNKNRKLHDGKKTYLPGDEILGLSQEDEDQLVSQGFASRIKATTKNIIEGKKDAKLIPEGNVEELKKYIATINDAALLENMAAEEKTDKKRKTLINAIEERIGELGCNNDDLNKDDSNEELNLDLNPSEVITK